MTAVAPLFSDPYRQRFAELMARRREPDAIAKLRRAAFDRFEKQGLPTRQQEAWRLTDLSALQAIGWQRPGDVPVDTGTLPTLDKTPTHRLVFVNGRFAPGLSRLRDLRGKTLIASLGQALLTHPELIEPHLDRLPGLKNQPFADLNTAFWEDGVLIYLPHGTVVETPIHLIFHTTGDSVAVHPRLLLVMEAQTQATVVVEYGGQGRYLHGPLAELAVGEGAVLDYHQLQEEAPGAFHLGGIRLRQKRASQANLHLIALGGQLARVDLDALLDGEGARCQINGLTLARNQQFSDVHVRVEHAQPHGTSEQVFKSVLDDKARTVFDGMIHVRQHAQKTDARQTNRNLLLSRQAQAQANPRLEILADDVKCGHGSSTGFLDPDAEFYLRARGIPVAQARALLVHAFANDSLNRIHLTPLRERLARLLAGRLALDFLEEEKP
ncbi:MAG TPA: Fe-S cluster assembly protein SufD [Candidatus Competibacteraceae bacterium]|nr:Fe-S cluster assembly protein SufD [Candidatus Competibacteraceae bacterium]HRZ07134.1 Fe-S cluster assembly protein SufD [Candidatus Competibacteraceae bacterium]HSA45065.1 Fe-S cluster assembly protein SufD [Candidatus Competibacteraceae bacterium]